MAPVTTPRRDRRVRPQSRLDDLRRRGILGLVGGAIATLVMTAYRVPISRSLPPTADFWARYVGSGDPADYPLVGFVLHVAYGAGAGALFALLAPGRARRDVVAERRDALLGLGYGLVLSAFGRRVVLGRLLGMDLSPDERLVFHASHAVYGLALGTWLGSRLADEGSERPQPGRRWTSPLPDDGVGRDG